MLLPTTERSAYGAASQLLRVIYRVLHDLLDTDQKDVTRCGDHRVRQYGQKEKEENVRL